MMYPVHIYILCVCFKLCVYSATFSWANGLLHGLCINKIAILTLLKLWRYHYTTFYLYTIYLSVSQSVCLSKDERLRSYSKLT